MTTLDVRSDPATVAQIVDRAARDDYHRWAEQVACCGYCTRPVRLRGRVVHHTPGGTRTVYSTDAEPDRVLMIRCGNRRASVCPSCSYEYAGDMWQLLYAGAAGGRKGVPDSIRAHPLVFATLTAPGFGPVHTTRTDHTGRGRCRPPKGKPTLCRHGHPTWCTAVHTEDDPRLGQPLCPDCYDYPAHVAFNWHAPELWRRFTITLPRVLARKAGISAAEFRQRCRVSYAKVAEYQRRAIVHFHALIRLDAPDDQFTPPDLPLGAADLAHAIREAAGLVRLVVDLPDASGRPAPQLDGDLPGFLGEAEPAQQTHAADQQPVTVAEHRAQCRIEQEGDGSNDQHRQPDAGMPRVPALLRAKHTSQLHAASMGGHDQLVLRFGTQTDVQAINGGPGGELTPERVAAYIAKYATKSADEFGVGDRRISLDALPLLGLTPHVERIVRTCWDLGGHPTYEGLRRWLHMLGFRGHFASKSRRYSTTLGAIRGERRAYRRRQAAEDARLAGEPDPDDETTLFVARWQFAGLGYLTTGDAALALSAAARAREQRMAARDARTEPPTGSKEDTSWAT